MKKYVSIIPALSMLILISSCKKSDIASEIPLASEQRSHYIKMILNLMSAV